MRIAGDEEFWQQMAAHSSARYVRAPWSVQQQLAGLVGEGTISGSSAAYQPEEPTIWSVFVVTDDGRLIRLRVEFALSRYEFDEEQSPYRQQHPVESTVHEAWVRRLNDAVRLEVRTVGTRLDGFRNPTKNEINLGDVHLAFSDGTVVDLEVDQLEIYDPDERTRTDAFLDAVRRHARL